MIFLPVAQSRSTQAAVASWRARSTASVFNSRTVLRWNSNSRTPEDYYNQRRDFTKDIEALPEQKALHRLNDFVSSKGVVQIVIPRPQAAAPTTDPHETIIYRRALDAALATFGLHVESRIAALMGQGFYTIGPCGEEALSSAAGAFLPQDAMALHYRHVGVNLCRQLLQVDESDNDQYEAVLKQIVLDRARGYTVSKNDPVTGGVHCSIGSGPDEDGNCNDYLVTSTLASQCPPAVGRALGYSLQRKLLGVVKGHRSQRPVSFVTLGDGSFHHGYFWSSYQLARHACHMNKPCPVVFGVADNGISISYKTKGFVGTIFSENGAQDPLVPHYIVDGSDMWDVYEKTKMAVDYARRKQAPVILIYRNLQRRFGHAATDRQGAYLTLEEMETLRDNAVLERTIANAVTRNIVTYEEVNARLQQLQQWTTDSFAQASSEDKVTRQDMIDRVQRPVVALPCAPAGTGKEENNQVMRKHMTRLYHELLEENPTMVYVGEDVRHGGYYLVTDGLAQKFPHRVVDFPPDETTLVGAALGMAQLGLLPVCEIPYGKYLECGADMFAEAPIINWLVNPKHKQVGMIVRLQGFDRGLFGGNFHTHNLLTQVLPGMDVVCYSNGADYVKGMRNAVGLAKAGRIVMSVDCTALLNTRHLHGSDRGWETTYPTADNCVDPVIDLDYVGRYGTSGSMALVTYGNGVVTALQARKKLVDEGNMVSEDELDIIDSPLLSEVSKGLAEALPSYKKVLFADICKGGPGGGILSPLVTSLHEKGVLPSHWGFCAAPRTYNPLGSMETFLNVEDICEAVQKLEHRSSS